MRYLTNMNNICRLFDSNIWIFKYACSSLLFFLSYIGKGPLSIYCYFRLGPSYIIWYRGPASPLLHQFLSYISRGPSPLLFYIIQEPLICSQISVRGPASRLLYQSGVPTSPLLHKAGLLPFLPFIRQLPHFFIFFIYFFYFLNISQDLQSLFSHISQGLCLSCPTSV